MSSSNIDAIEVEARNGFVELGFDTNLSWMNRKLSITEALELACKLIEAATVSLKKAQELNA